MRFVGKMCIRDREQSVNAIRGMVGRGARELCLASLKGCFNREVPEEAFEAVHRGFMREYPHREYETVCAMYGVGKITAAQLMACLLYTSRCV